MGGGVGSFLFLRASRLASVPSFLGGLRLVSFAGAMTAQISHIGLVEGMSWAPVALVALLKLSEQWREAIRPPWHAAATGHDWVGPPCWPWR